MGWRSRRSRRDLRDELPERVWGMPTACPACGGHGYLDHIDLVNETMQQHCVSCGYRWETVKHDTTIVVNT